MKKLFQKRIFILSVLLFAFAFVFSLLVPSMSFAKGGKDKPLGEEEPTTGNNLSFPVIWAEGVTKTLRGTADMDPLLGGDWWYWWGTEGTDPNVVPLSCPPDPDNPVYCDDEIAGETTGELPGEGWVRAYLQKDSLNVWQAEAANGINTDPLVPEVVVDSIDWGDSLESVDWYTRSQVRIEVVLYKSLPTPMLEYQMRHVSGWGIDEVHGLSATATDSLDTDPVAEIGEGTQATIYSNCARLTIQKLLVDRDDSNLANLRWVPGAGWTESDGYEGGDLINEPIFNKTVSEGGDGPSYYSAEINVKGKVIYGYTWNVKLLHDDTEDPLDPNALTAAGDYRITFSLDPTDGSNPLNTDFVEYITNIIVPLEEELIVAAEEESDDSEPGGGTAYIDYGNNLTYIDVRILERDGGSGNGNGGEGNGNHNGPPER